MRFVLSASLCVLISSLAFPQPKDGKTTVLLTVDAAKQAKPALKYTLLPEVRDLNPGNQIPAFYKCFMEQHYLYRAKEAIDYREKMLVAPLAELKGEKHLIGYGGSSTRQADYAARLDNIDWGILTQLKTEGVFLLLPDVQQLRELAQVLKLRLRGEIARGEFDAAIRSTQTLFALGRAFESHPTLIGQLVGVAIISLTLDAVEELIQQPGAPNLFWALANLPQSIISLQKGIEGERAWLSRDFDVLRKPEPLTDAELNHLAGKLDPILKAEGTGGTESVSMYYKKLTLDKVFIANARESLIDLGFTQAQLAKLSPLQIAMSYDFLNYEVFRDDLLKWTNIPYWQISEEVLNRKTPEGVFSKLAPSLLRVKQAQTRLQQRIDMLRIAEAIRAYAHENAGKMPASLDAIKLPLPPDAVTGKPFVYEVKKGFAMLRSTPPRDRAKEPAFTREFAITIRK
jgi:hypothetical protein